MEEAGISAQVVSIVTDVLRVVYMLETLHPGVLEPVTLATKLSRLYCIFLAGQPSLSLVVCRWG